MLETLCIPPGVDKRKPAQPGKYGVHKPPWEKQMRRFRVKQKENTMKRNIRWLALLAALLLAVGMWTGCAKSDEQVLTAALKNAGELKSVHMKMTLPINMSLLRQTLRINMEVEGDYFTEPVTGMQKFHMEADGESMDAVFYYEMISGTCNSYIGYTMDGLTEWVRQELEDIPAGMSNATNVDGYKDLVLTEQEGEKDNNLLHFTGKADRTQMESMLQMLDMSERNALFGDEESIKKVLDGMETTEVHITVDRKLEQIVAIEMDLSTLMKAVFEMALSSQSDMDFSSLLSFEELPLRIEYSRFNDAEPFEIPQEARDAELFEE